jgi:UDP:flavonoid glycosyltransferase YjiC (YdhE family)
MEERDFERIVQLVSELKDTMKARFDQVDARLDQVDARFGQVDARFEQVDANARSLNVKLDEFKVDMIAEFNRSVAVHEESVQKGIAAIADGHQALWDKIDEVENNLGRRIDAVAAGLAAHCADNDAHCSIYGVKES